MRGRRAKVLLLDHQDSFTFNLAQALASLGAQVLLRQASPPRLAEWAALKATHVLLSPGPGHPVEAAGALAAARRWSGKKPLLGVCLGHQALALAFGARISPARRPMHGKASKIQHDGKGLFRGLPQGFTAIRYHSLQVDPQGLPGCLSISAWTAEGEIMGLRHMSGAEGVQFHPESILSACGTRFLSNFLSLR